MHTAAVEDVSVQDGLHTVGDGLAVVPHVVCQPSGVVVIPLRPRLVDHLADRLWGWTWGQCDAYKDGIQPVSNFEVKAAAGKLCTNV